MEQKKLYESLTLQVIRVDESDCIRTSGEPARPTSILVSGDAIQWQESWE